MSIRHRTRSSHSHFGLQNRTSFLVQRLRPEVTSSRLSNNWVIKCQQPMGSADSWRGRKKPPVGMEILSTSPRFQRNGRSVDLGVTSSAQPPNYREPLEGHSEPGNPGKPGDSLPPAPGRGSRVLTARGSGKR
ncbi:hypothetical protein BGZ61DRAFT_218790 [Ilyonectria robusta]|uniref:uncharacterized protein n=1 Tax=Ilyonectria robusta TaxID=1079257 RepID=UPI001E8CD0EB|nr:uncharacterized protein BGZ61DRAFT_218790 [Ilyonectria robusta]KAH8706248.1 hypothetical protein BGZ61DRAFT_218790 [Ilyonectria robusta]